MTSSSGEQAAVGAARAPWRRSSDAARSADMLDFLVFEFANGEVTTDWEWSRKAAFICKVDLLSRLMSESKYILRFMK
jgi:hypothetical protein